MNLLSERGLLERPEMMDRDFMNSLPPGFATNFRHLLVKYGGGILAASGSIGGQVHSRNRFGAYIRARTKPVNPKSPRQVGARVAVMYLAEQWRESPMTDVIRAAWQTYADSVNWTNKLGESVKLTGFNMFMRANTVLLNIGEVAITAAPTDLGLPAGDPLMQVSACSAAGQNFTLTFDDGMDWCTEDGGFLCMQQGKPQNPTRNFFNGPWRSCAFATGVDPGGVASPLAGLPNIGYPIVEGQKIWWRGAILRADGRISTKFECAPVIAVA